MLSEKYDVCHYVFEAGENSKHLGTISDFYNFFVEEKLDRKSVVVALGGGVVGDMAGFAASTYMRGISFVQVPTTLLAQVDSSVGGKTGVDFNGNKNMIGAFYQPDFVFINSETLKTLPYREVAAGIAEAIKYGYIIDKDFLEYCVENKGSIKSLDNNALIEVIYKCCEAKAYVVSKDEKELGLRAILNFGHTFGHSVETLNNFKLLHVFFGEPLHQLVHFFAELVWLLLSIILWNVAIQLRKILKILKNYLNFLNFLLDVITMLMKFIIRCFMIKRLQVAK